MGEEGYTDPRALQASPGPDLFPSSSQTNEFELEISEPILECLWSRCNLSIDCSGAGFDALVKRRHSRHSREGGSPEVLEFPGFPFSRE
jgi:hypothetical protein